MAEVITETILPGTYIEVRAEGLLTIGAVPVGNIGIIGTAEKGSDEVEILSSLAEGQAIFGRTGVWDPSADGGNLNLVRALKLLFDNGARTVYAQRVFDDTSASAATYQILNEDNGPVLTLKAKTPGTWGNRLQIKVEKGDARELISNERITPANGVFALSAQGVPSPGGAEASIGNVVVREDGLSKKYQLKQIAASSEVVQLDPTALTLTFAEPPPATAEVRASYWADNLRRVTLQYENVQEVYIVPSIYYLAQLLQDERSPSKLVDVVGDTGRGLPKATTRFEAFSGGGNGSVSGTRFEAAFEAALEKLVDQNVQIVVVVGWDFSVVKSDILGHVEKTENLGRERIAVIGADSSDVEKILENTNEVADKRVVLVAPGLKQADPETGRMMKLPPYFAAAAVAGKLSSLAPHVSLTNKTLAGIDGLAEEYNYGQLKSLVDNRVLALQKKRGMRVVKGITTHDEAFRQITLRRIIDYIKEGTRRGANQYIGKLNNARVRSALHTTLNGFLTSMVTSEFLTGYTLEVFADRAMEIRGEVQVTMDLQPTFSIDVIRVIMNLS